MELRDGRRYTVDLPVRLIGLPGAVGAGRLTRLSRSGGVVATGLRLAPLTAVRLRLASSAPDRPWPAEILAVVVRTSANGLCLQWSRSDSRRLASLGASVAPDALERRRLARIRYG